MFDKYKKRITSLFLMSTLLVSFNACSDDDENDDNGWHIEGNTTITVKPERTKLLRNPLNGWVMYSGLGDGLSDTFWEEYDNFDSSIGKVKVSDYSTTLFIRGAWSDFNPEEGKYAWDDDVNTIPAQRFKKLVNGAKERKMKLALSFIVDSRDKSYDFTPKYVRDAVGDAGGYLVAVGTSTTNKVWSPYPDNAIFQQYYEKFIQDVAKKYDDPDVTDFISGTGLGKWGESHTVWYSTNDDAPKAAVFEWVTDVYSKAFKKVPLVINYHRWILSRQTWDGSKYAADSESLLNSAINKGYSLRHDAFGMKTYYTTWERNFAASKKFQRPIIGEGGWVRNSHGSSITGDGYATYADVRVGEFSDAKAACVNMLDFRYTKSANGETYSWFNDAFHLVQQFIAEGGYRLYPEKLSLPKDIKNGSSIAITHRWVNLGWGYCPTNLPQWNGRYKIAFALLDKNSLAPKYVFVDQQSELSTFIKGSAKKLSFKQEISNVAIGNYVWAIGIVDTTKDNNKIGIQISAKENITDEGWLTLTDVSVQ